MELDRRNPRMRRGLDSRVGCGKSLSGVGRPIGMRDRRSTLSFRACVTLHLDGKRQRGRLVDFSLCYDQSQRRIRWLRQKSRAINQTLMKKLEVSRSQGQDQRSIRTNLQHSQAAFRVSFTGPFSSPSLAFSLPLFNDS